MKQFFVFPGCHVIGVPGAEVLKPSRAPFSKDLPFLGRAWALLAVAAGQEAQVLVWAWVPSPLPPRWALGSLRWEPGLDLDRASWAFPGPPAAASPSRSPPTPAGGPLAPSSPPKIGLTANRQSLPSFTAGDLWPIARGFFARSRQGRPIGAVPRPRLGVGQGCGGGWGVSRGTG